MNPIRRLLALSCILCVPSLAAAVPSEPDGPRPQVEVVFCLDTTGSMGGLIEGAKQKIWKISNQIVSGKPTPELKIGLVAYRDRGDAYVTEVTQLTDDLDAIHTKLLGYKADGGGDGPESVNQALHESITKIKWSTDKETLRIVFLVGDAPPHMDYGDDVKYLTTCELARKNGISVNAVQCGGNAECQKVWEEISTKADGRFVRIAQDGGVVAIKTPFDEELAKLNAKMGRSILCFGDGAKMEKDLERKRGVIALPTAPAPAGPGGEAAGIALAGTADRAAYAARSGKVASFDLIDAIKADKVKLEDLKEEQLPEELQKLKPAEREAHLKKIEKEREEIRAQCLALEAKRTKFVAEKMKEKAEESKDGFDEKVLDILRDQAKKAKIKY